jgi:hypothetical protein
VLKGIQAALEAFNENHISAPKAQQSSANVVFMPIVALL